MIRNVMNSESPIRIWLGGNCCVPSACRSRESTMMSRVKLVIMIRIAGASDRTVSRMMICIADEKFSRLLRSGSFSSAAGNGACAAGDEGAGFAALGPVSSPARSPVVSCARAGWGAAASANDSAHRASTHGLNRNENGVARASILIASPTRAICAPHLLCDASRHTSGSRSAELLRQFLHLVHQAAQLAARLVEAELDRRLVVLRRAPLDDPFCFTFVRHVGCRQSGARLRVRVERIARPAEQPAERRRHGRPLLGLDLTDQ